MSINLTNVTRSGNGRVVVMPTSGYVFSSAPVFAGISGRERHEACVTSDVTGTTSAPKQHPGTQVWSPPT